jgi:hypothetical protein
MFEIGERRDKRGVKGGLRGSQEHGTGCLPRFPVSQSLGGDDGIIAKKTTALFFFLILMTSLSRDLAGNSCFSIDDVCKRVFQPGSSLFGHRWVSPSSSLVYNDLQEF